jgi:signal transduction histidine kinase
MGMGLALARDLVEKMDGRLEVTSIPGTGTTFSVMLPASRS